MSTPTYLFAGGGTGGHLMPGIAVAEELVRRNPEARIVFAGSEREIERRILESQGCEHRPLAIEPSTMLRRNPLRFAWRYWQATRDARRILGEIRPAVVVGLGGFASVPVVSAAAGRGMPIVLLEQNTVPGRATTWLAKRANTICTSFDETATHLPGRSDVIATGNPVRRAIADLHDGPKSDGTPMLLVLGGSQGAVAVNEAVVELVERARTAFAGWRIVHQSGPRDVDRVRSAYDRSGIEAVVEPFFDDLVPHYRTASLAITRAGATSLAELACAGVPTMMVPYPGAIHDHQTRNARHYAHAGAGWLVPQENAEATSAALAGVVESLLREREALGPPRAAMHSLARPDAAARVADVVENLRSR